MAPPSNQPQGCKREKEDQKAKKQTKSSIINAQVRTITNMVVAILERTPIVRNQSMMTLFSVPNDQLQSHETWEYFYFHNQEELQLL